MQGPNRAGDGPRLGVERRSALAGLNLGDDRRNHLVEITDHGPVGLGHHVGFLVGVDRQDVLRRHCADPVLDGTRDARGDVDLRGDPGSGLADLVGVRTPTEVGHRTRATDTATEQGGGKRL